MSLFDVTDLAEVTSPLFPSEQRRLLQPAPGRGAQKKARGALCRHGVRNSPASAAKGHGRTRTPLDKAEIGKRAGSVLHHFKMGKHNSLAIGEGTFSFARKDEAIRREKVLGGFYVILTSKPRDRLSTDDTLRSYKSLAQVDEVFRSLKGLDLLIRPIWLRTEDHVKAHVFLCFLAYHWSGTCERPRRRSPQRQRRDVPCGRPHRPDLHGRRKQPASRPRVFLSAPRV